MTSWIVAPEHARRWKLGDNAKSRKVPGIHLRITNEPGSPSEFGIFNRHEGNNTSAYTDEGRDGYRKWIGKWFGEIHWDRDTMAPPPYEDLFCVHLTEVLADGSLGPKYGWLFTQEIEPRSSPSTEVGSSSAVPVSVSSETISKEEEAKIIEDVQRRKQEIEKLRKDVNKWNRAEQEKVDAYSVQIQKLQQQIRLLESEQRQAEEKFWDESNRKTMAINAKEKEMNEIMFRHDTIHFP